MIRLRRGRVLAARRPRHGVQELEVRVDGRRQRAIAYPALSGRAPEGSTVVLNTTALAKGLGTGGVHVVIAVEGGEDLDVSDQAHVMKLRYTPHQVAVEAVEQQGGSHRAALETAGDLEGLPVAWAPLHSMVGAVAAGAKASGAGRIAYLMTDGAALPAWFSDQIDAVRGSGLVDAVITCGQAVGGDLEAVNVFSGLLAAQDVARADAVVVADGPGKVGTATTWGASEVAGGAALNAAGILGGRPVAALRVSFADPSYRHHGVSPHSITVLSRVALVPVHVAVPALEDEDRRGAIWESLKDARLEERHQLVEVTGGPALELLRDRGVPLATMGRGPKEDPEFFLAAGAAGVLAGRMAAASARWRREPGR